MHPYERRQPNLGSAFLPQLPSCGYPRSAWHASGHYTPDYSQNATHHTILQSLVNTVIIATTKRAAFLTLKEPGGRNPPPPRHFLLYLSWLLFFRAETSWLFFFKPCAHFKTIFRKIGPGVMTRRCVIERWVQRKTDQKLIFNGNYTQIVFFVVFLFQETLSLCFILFIWFIWSKNMCKHTLTHIIAKKCNFCLKK